MKVLCNPWLNGQGEVGKYAIAKLRDVPGSFGVLSYGSEKTGNSLASSYFLLRRKYILEGVIEKR